MEYPNVPQSLGVAMRYETLFALDTHFSLEDMYDLLEVKSVDAHNSARAERASRKGVK